MTYNAILLALFLSTLFKVNGFFEHVSMLQPAQISNELFNWIILRLLKFCFARFGALIFTYCCRKEIDSSNLSQNYKLLLNTVLLSACYLYVYYFT